jgi:hypothetical protein
MISKKYSVCSGCVNREEDWTCFVCEDAQKYKEAGWHIIERLDEKVKELEGLLKEALPIIYNTYDSECIGPESLPSKIEQAIKKE